jgi:trehalose 6-phosphate phosphatase
VSAALESVLAPLRDDPGSAAVLCDVDGTLAPIVERPPDARVPADTADLLGELAQRYAVVGCVSGRPAAEVREMIGRDDLVYVGNHGYELLGPGEPEATANPALSGREEDAARFVRGIDAAELDAAGLRLEDKGPIQALHWRGAPDVEAAERRARAIAERAEGEGLVTHRGRKVLEVRPAVEIDKGTAMADLVRREGVQAALYGGDDRTDVDAFRRLRELASSGELRAAICIGVASDEGPPEVTAEADAVVDGPRGFAEALRMLE